MRFATSAALEMGAAWASHLFLETLGQYSIL